MTVPGTPVAQLVPAAASPVSPRRHVVSLHPPFRAPGHDAPLERAPRGLRLSAPSGERAVGLVPCGIETELALDVLRLVQSRADAAEPRVYLAIIFLLCSSAVVIVVPGVWIAAMLAMLLVILASWRFASARVRLQVARERAQARLGEEGCFAPEIRFLTSPAAGSRGLAAASPAAPPPPSPSSPPKLQLVR